MRTTFPSLVLYALVAVATFNCVLAVPVPVGIMGFELPTLGLSDIFSQKIAIIGLDAMEKETGRLEIPNNLPQTYPNGGPKGVSARAPGSTIGKFLRALPANCVLDLYRMETRPNVGMIPVGRGKIKGPRDKDTTFTTVLPGGVFDRMKVTCYRDGHKHKTQ
ncbi:hypothetical protein BDP27DRAFT_1402650 [Rhodocollybia butyracea]|uniref:Uncharacterized protein n=1 Tax=Rhodocollybia butyracea TaxID=206335 RepID=A0A9P5PSN6_9AGAR|nr:hypothetical protein BDP27DRAFT_1402650 [Rhodocollybia butyracea]